MAMEDKTAISGGAKKPAVRRKKVLSSASISAETPMTVSKKEEETEIIKGFSEVFEKLKKSQEDFESLQKEIKTIRENWKKEQQDYQNNLANQQKEEEISRKREQENYDYELNLKRRKAEDEFNDKKEKWEKELSERKNELIAQKEELDDLRQQVSGFEKEKEKAIKESLMNLRIELEEKFDAEIKTLTQAQKAEKSLLELRIENLTSENSRLTKEIESSKKALDESTRQIKEIAVSVIESGKPPPQNPI